MGEGYAQREGRAVGGPEGKYGAGPCLLFSERGEPRGVTPRGGVVLPSGPIRCAVRFHSSHEIHSTGQVEMASSMQVSSPPSGLITLAFSASSSISKTSGQSSEQLAQPVQHSSSNTTLRAMFWFSFMMHKLAFPVTRAELGAGDAPVAKPPQRFQLSVFF